MCCNGVLFHTVRLQAQDSAKQLAALGFRLKHKQAHTVFEQPCQAWKPEGCKIYDDRPCRCRQFECRQVSQLTSGMISWESALAAVSEASFRVSRLQLALEQCGSRNANRPLLKRAAMLLNENGGEPVSNEAFRNLREAMLDLEAWLDQEFRCEDPEVK